MDKIFCGLIALLINLKFFQPVAKILTENTSMVAIFLAVWCLLFVGIFYIKEKLERA